MLRLHGFSASNYYNVAKLTLLEKGVEFEEVLVYTGAGETYRPEFLTISPQGKVPCLETEHGFLSETRAIAGYLEEVHPEPALYPRDAFARAKVHELTHVLDLYLDLPVRRVLRNFFSRSKPPASVADEVRAALAKTARTLTRLARFDSFLMGDEFGAADVAAACHFPMARMVARETLDFDPLADVPGIDDYVARLEARPTVQRIRADHRAALPGFLSHLQQLYAVRSGST
jgi:glutathione S-transferase